uniref:5-cytosine rRNA methyltransferase NSUN4 n=1 Tax=Piliocolobus tephrosceles TaxID=591936 RepID=A0A8C9HQX1_9PRIM
MSELANITDIIKYDDSIEQIDKLIYYLNPCSVLSAYFLNVQKNEKVLDMCASPGGKSIVLANKIFGFDTSPLNRIKNINIKNNSNIEIKLSLDVLNYYKINKAGLLVVNEFNKNRYLRLKDVLHKYLPTDLIKSGNIHIINYNGLKLNSFVRYEKFHKILLDVPCSSDEHLIKKKSSDINRWSVNIIKNNSNVQFELLLNAFHLLLTKGIIIYSTCALSYHENDNVIERLIKKFNKHVNIIDFVQEEYEKIYTHAMQQNYNINMTKNNEQFIQNDIINVTECKYHISQNNGELNKNNLSKCVNKEKYEYVTNTNLSNANLSVDKNTNNSYKQKSTQNNSSHTRSTDKCDFLHSNHFKKFKEKTNFLKFFEKTKYGYISLPDKSPFGVLYICKIQKV